MALYRLLKPVRLQTGRYRPGTVQSLPDPVAEMLLRRGDIEPWKPERPSLTVGEIVSALPAVQASPRQTPTASMPGARRRGRTPRAGA